jgi:paraquat-inducible protein B
MSETPKAVVEKQTKRASLLWLVPIVALASVLAVLFVRAGAERGPRITITFADASGLLPGADLIHRGLHVGVVRTVELDTDLKTVIVNAELAPHAAGLAAEGTSFWIVKPEVSLDRVSGLETLLGPRYIAVRPSEEPGRRWRRFEGLSESVRGVNDFADEGLPIRLNARSAGSISVGSSLLYRNMHVGQVTGLRLADNAQHVEIDAVVEPKYAPLIRDNTRFWDASGVGVDFGLFRGLSVAAGSLDSVLRGAIGIAAHKKPGDTVAAGHEFELAPSVDNDWLEWQPEIRLGSD